MFGRNFQTKLFPEGKYVKHLCVLKMQKLLIEHFLASGDQNTKDFFSIALNKGTNLRLKFTE